MESEKFQEIALNDLKTSPTFGGMEMPRKSNPRKSSPKKRKKAKRYKPIALHLSDEKIAAIKADLAVIGKKYGFKEDYDLYQNLLSLRSHVDAHEIAVMNYPRPAETKDQLVNLLKTAKELSRLFARNTALQTKIRLLEAPELFAQRGYTNLKRQNGDWHFNQFQKDLDVLIRNAHFALELVPVDQGGRKAFCRAETAIFWLASYFGQGTDTIPRCGEKYEKNCYIGEFYDFILDIEGCLNDVGIDLPNRKTIGKYATIQSSRYRALIGKK